MRSCLLGRKAALVIVALGVAGALGGVVRAQPGAGGPCTPSTTLTCEQLVALGYDYPYAREPRSYLFVNGAAYPYIELGGGQLARTSVQVGRKVVVAADLLSALGHADQIARRRTPVIGYGSNATVSALTRKYVTPSVIEPAVIPVTRAVLRDYDVVWSPHLVSNGAMPATIVPSRGTSVEVWINWLDDAQLRHMHDTEAVGSFYSYGTLSGVKLDSEVPLSGPPRVYVDCYGALALRGVFQAIRTVPARGRRFPAVDSEQAMRRVARHMGWTDSVFDLLLDNVRSPLERAGRTQALTSLGRFPDDPHYRADCPCGAGSCPVP